MLGANGLASPVPQSIVWNSVWMAGHRVSRCCLKFLPHSHRENEIFLHGTHTLEKINHHSSGHGNLESFVLFFYLYQSIPEVQASYGMILST